MGYWVKKHSMFWDNPNSIETENPIFLNDIFSMEYGSPVDKDDQQQ